MKKYFFILMLCLGLGINKTSAQAGNESSVLPLLYEGESRYKALVDNFMTIARFEIDVVNQSPNKFAPVKLISGKTYSVILIGELKVIEEIELKIYTYLNRSMDLVSESTNSARMLETTFKPDKNDFYEFEIIAKKFSPGNKAGKYCLIIAY